MTAVRVAPLALAALLATGCQEYDLRVYEAVDVFFQDPPPAVDVLLVIDNSGSMYGYQLLVGYQFPQFLSWFVDADIDYHIGVVTTTVERPPYPLGDCTEQDLDALPEAGHLYQGTWITPETEQPDEVFADLINVGICGSGDEQGLEAARIALSEELQQGANAGFIRPEADLTTVFVSDEQDASFDPVHAYARDYWEVKQGGDRAAFNASAMVIPDHDLCQFPEGGSTEGTRYVELAEETGGVVANLCDTDAIADTMAEISFRSSRLRDTFFLSGEPNAATLQVSVEDTEIPCDGGAWSYERVLDKPAIVFDRLQMPRPGEQIAVRYDLGDGDPATQCTGEAAAEGAE